MKTTLSEIQMSVAAVEIRRLSHNLEHLFGKTQEGEILTARCRDAIDELVSFAEGRGMRGIAVAVLGAKNAGKSWLCRLLVKNDTARERIPSGETSQFSTEKATWIGPDAPPALDSAHEIRIPLRRDEMIDLGTEYTLLDLPGFNDASIPAREAALRALSGVPLRVLVVSLATMGDESQFAFLAKSDGTRILPVIVDETYPRLEKEGTEEIAAFLNRIRLSCSLAEVLEPIVVPHIRNAPGDAAKKLKLAEELLISVFRQFVASPPIDQHAIGRVVIERLRKALAVDLSEFVKRVTPAHDNLVTKEAELAAELVKKILGPDSQLQAGMRMKMRMHSLTRTPGWFFPFKSFLGLFAITAGAWDRMAFALAGSLPSLTLLVFQTARNAKRLGEMKDEVKSALAKRIETMARDELADLNCIFIRSINDSLPQDIKRTEDESPPARFIGLEQVTEESSELFDKVVRSHAGGGIGLFLWGGLATLVFITLLSGPIVAIYREFLDAWVGVFGAPDRHKWQSFPAPSSGMIFTSILLAVLPVLFCAMVACIRATPTIRIQNAVAEAKALHLAMLEGLTKNKSVRLVTKDPVREAARNVIDFLR